LSLGTDQRLRRKVAKLAAPGPGGLVADICGGTGDLAAEVRRLHPQSTVVLVDFAEQMLRLAKQKLPDARIHAVAGDACRLPLADGSCDAVTAGFGFRNLQSVRAGLLEAARVLRPGGRVVLLELFRPDGALAPLQSAVLRAGVPGVAWFVAPGRVPAYRYLARSILDFVTRDEMVALMRECGFRDLEMSRGLFGYLTVIGATRP
ncbi:unnamed protein product, partial [marine sediment metagenome]